MNSEYYDQYEAQSALQREGIEAQQTMNAPMLHEQMQQAQAILVSQTDPKRIVKEIVLRLQGLREEPDGKLTKIADPKLNELGIQNITFILESHINQNTILSHLDKHEIRNLMRALSISLVDCLTLNWKAFGITRKTDLDVINDSVLVNVYLALKRAEGQGEKNWLGKISVEQISGAPRFQKTKSDSWWDKFRL